MVVRRIRQRQAKCETHLIEYYILKVILRGLPTPDLTTISKAIQLWIGEIELSCTIVENSPDVLR